VVSMSLTELKPLSQLISLRGKRALITGAASGIGEAIALRFAEAGAYLYLVDIDEEGLKTVADEVKGLGSSAETFRVDLSRKEEIDRLWEQLRGREPDILVNNAGVPIQGLSGGHGGLPRQGYEGEPAGRLLEETLTH